ncbi:MAG: NUDIX hydrolase, partial [Myxococcota bacterium]
IKSYVRHSSSIVLTTPIFNVRKDRVSNPNTGYTGDFFVLENPNWANVIALDTQGRLIMVRQWRHGTETVEVEFPAGLVDPGEEPEMTALRELREETGYTTDRVTLLGATKPNVAYQSNTCYTFLAEGCHRVAEPTFDRGEHAETFLIDPAEVGEWVQAGKIRSAISLSALFWWMNHRQRLTW